jgi:hypothetical protein
VITKGQIVKHFSERRKHPRIQKNFAATLKVVRTSAKVEGFTLDLSQGGAFISSTSLSAFHENDQTEVSLLLPPEFSGQPKILLLKGTAIVKRIHEDKGGIAVEFLKQLRTFQPSWLANPPN